MTDPRSEQGFTLVEVLVAFVCVSLGLVTLYSALGGSFRLAAVGSIRDRALLDTQSHLNSLGHTVLFGPGRFRGTYSNGTVWDMTVAVLPDGSSERVQVGAVLPVSVTLDAIDRSGHNLVHLRTVKLIAVRPQQVAE